MNQRTDKIIRKKLMDAEQAYPAGLWEQIAPQIPDYPSGKAQRWRPVLLFTALGLFLALAFWFGQNAKDRGEVFDTSQQAAGFVVNDPGTPAISDNAGNAGDDQEMSKPALILAGEEPENPELSSPSGPKVKAGQPALVQPVKKFSNLKADAANKLSQAPASEGTAVHPVSLKADTPANRDALEVKGFNQFQGTNRTSVRSPAITQLKSEFTTSPFMTSDRQDLEIDGIGPDPDCYSFGRRHQSNFTIDVYTGLGIALRPMGSANEDVSNYIDARQETESFKYLFTFGGRINLMMNNGLAFRGGLHYTQIGEKFDYTDTSAVRIITIIDTTFVGGDTIVNTTQEVQEGTIIKRINNRFHSIDIPLLVGYDVPLGRMQASVSAGPVLNISAWQRGQFLSPSLEPVFIETDSPDYYPAYKTSLGIGVYLSAALAVPITEKMWLFGEPYMLHRFNPVTLDDYSIRQQNTNMGLNVGLKLKI